MMEDEAWRQEQTLCDSMRVQIITTIPRLDNLSIFQQGLAVVWEPILYLNDLYLIVRTGDRLLLDSRNARIVLALNRANFLGPSTIRRELLATHLQASASSDHFPP